MVDSAASPALSEAQTIATLEKALGLARGLAAVANEQRDALINHLHEGLLLLDATGHVALLNDEYCRQLGLALPATQWLGMSALALAEQVKGQFADPTGFMNESKRVWQQQTVELGTELLLADGRVLERDAQPMDRSMGAGFLVSYRDVTARHQANEAAREISLVPEQNPNPVMRFNAVGDRLYANAAARLLQSRLPYAAHATLCAGLQKAAIEALDGQQRQQLVVQAGSAWFQVEVIPLVADGYVNFYLIDITGRYEAEMQLAAQRTFYEAILNSLPAEVVVVDDAFRYQYLNPAALADPAAREATLGQTLAEYDQQVGRPPDFTAHRMARFARAAAGDTPEWAETVDKPNGRRHYLRRIQPLVAPDGVSQWFIGYGLDVTDREQARQALVVEQAFTQQVLDAIPNMVFVRDKPGSFRFQNRANQEFMVEANYHATPAPGTARAALIARHAALDAEILAQDMAVVTEDQVTLLDGTIRWYQTAKQPLHLPDGPTQLLGVSTDITALKAAQLAAEAAAIARQNFLANMSHEIRTPMNGVLGMAAQLAKTLLDPRQQQLVGIMQRSGQHLLAVLNDVLDIAKISSGKLEMEQVAFNLCESMAAAVQPLALQAAEKGLAFGGTLLRTTCAYPWVIGDAHRLNQILINLVSNALKFTQKGSITVDGELVSETDRTLTVCFRVTDTGIGVAPAQQARIFESFTQAYADTSRQYGGTGLGLSISQALVVQLGGTLVLDSEVGRGSTFAFTVTLPKAPAGSDVTAAATTYDTGRLAGVRVLLVEDNEINRVVARMMLEPWGVQLDEAADGPAGLACLETHRYDLVLMDVQLPGLSGVTVTERLRLLPDPARAATPVIALTANAFRSEIAGYLAAGMNDYLAKPFDEQALFGKMVALLDAATPAPPPPLYDLAMLRRQAQGREAFVRQILHSFRTNMPTSLAEFGAAAAAARWAEAADLAHHIKPNLLALGVLTAVPALDVLEQAHHAAPGPLPEPAVLAAASEQLVTIVTQVLAAIAHEA